MDGRPSRNTIAKKIPDVEEVIEKIDEDFHLEINNSLVMDKMHID